MRYIAPFQVKLTESQRDNFKRVAKENKDNPSELVRKWIENYIKEKGE